MRAFNDFIADFCSYDNSRLKGIALVNIDDPAEAVAEMTRCRDMGLAGAMITVLPPADRSYDNPMYEPLWSAAADLKMPLSMHVATGRQTLKRVTGSDVACHRTSESGLLPPGSFRAQEPGRDGLLGRVRASSRSEGRVRSSTRWRGCRSLGPDGLHDTQRPGVAPGTGSPTPTPAPATTSPGTASSASRRTLSASRTRRISGSTLLWGSDYPHTESTFPRSREIVAEILADVPEDEQRMIVRDNAARLYDFDVPLQNQGVGARLPAATE